MYVGQRWEFEDLYCGEVIGFNTDYRGSKTVQLQVVALYPNNKDMYILGRIVWDYLYAFEDEDNGFWTLLQGQDKPS